MLVNKAAFDALDKPTQAAVLKAAADAQERGYKISEEKNDWYKKALAEKGMKIMKPSPKLMADMRQVGTIMLADWEKKAGADGQAVDRRVPQVGPGPSRCAGSSTGSTSAPPTWRRAACC